MGVGVVVGAATAVVLLVYNDLISQSARYYVIKETISKARLSRCLMHKTPTLLKQLLGLQNNQEQHKQEAKLSLG